MTLSRIRAMLKPSLASRMLLTDAVFALMLLALAAMVSLQGRDNRAAAADSLELVETQDVAKLLYTSLRDIEVNIGDVVVYVQAGGNAAEANGRLLEAIAQAQGAASVLASAGVVSKSVNLERMLPELDSLLATAMRVADLGAKNGDAAKLVGLHQIFNNRSPAVRDKLFLLQESIEDEHIEVQARVLLGMHRLEMAVYIGVLIGLLSLAARLAYIHAVIVRPARQLAVVTSAYAAGDFELAVPKANLAELDGIASALANFRETSAEAEQLRAMSIDSERRQQQAQAELAEARTRQAASALAAEQRSRNERRQVMAGLGERFEASIAHIVATLSAGAEDLDRSADALSAAMMAASHESGTVAAETLQACGNVRTVAAAADQMAASINEIARQVRRQTELSILAESASNAGSSAVSTLADKALNIGAISSLINTVAEQINLLALNATIEAARAGKAGRGFAVVAGEVKVLAAQTGNSTNEIGSLIQGVREGIHATVRSIGEVAVSLTRVRQVAGAVSTAVEQQHMSTAQISQHANDAANSTERVNQSMAAVAHAVAEAGTLADRVKAASNSLREQSDMLTVAAREFLEHLRAA